MTIQELMTHGAKSPDGTQVPNAFLSVTTVWPNGWNAADFQRVLPVWVEDACLFNVAFLYIF